MFSLWRKARRENSAASRLLGSTSLRFALHGWQRQYGSGIRGYVMNLLIAQMISLKRVQQSIQTLIGQILSEATILKYVMQLHHTLAAWEQSAIEQLLQMPAMHVDETSLRVDHKNHWIHVCSAGHITYKFLHPKRGLAAIEASGVIPRYGGVIIHD
ncbi:IS66 family transposase [Thiolapillus sp.]